MYVLSGEGIGLRADTWRLRRLYLLALILLLVAARPAAAQTVFHFTYSDGTNTAHGVLVATDLGGGTFLATSGTLTVTTGPDVGEYDLYANPSAPNPTVFPLFGASFVYDNLVVPGGNPSLDFYGLMFYRSGLGVNIFSNGAGSPYSFWSGTGSSYNVANNNGAFSLSVNQAPVAHAGADIHVNWLGTTSVKLDGTASTDPDGDTLDYRWYENGKQIAKGANTQVWFTVGIHNVTLIVTDPYGLSSSDEVIVHIDARPQTVVVAKFTPAQRNVPKTLLAHLKTKKGQLLNKPLDYYIDGDYVGTAMSEDPAGLEYTPPAGMTLGAHTITVKFTGDADYQPSEASSTLTIKK